MKTKIIYISGGEIFNMNDVRSAFDAVRNELGLGTDTVLFGVPVDAEDALGGQFDSAKENSATDINPIATESMNSDITDEPESTTQQKTEKKRRTKKVVSSDISEEQPSPKTEDITETKEEKVIPILSVLGNDATTDKEADNIVNQENTEEAPDVDFVSVTQETVASIVDDNIDTPEQQKTSDFITDEEDAFIETNSDNDIKTVETEITAISVVEDEDDQLAKLLESVKSLHEDKEEVPELKTEDLSIDETDATLEKLATEFAENQDKIVNTTKSGGRGGKIGKLKNILPFKKAKRNDSSLMGDLFGWAGVAANDEEFGIPEFFPTAVKK